MRAFAIEEFGAEGSVRNLPDPQPAEGQVRIRVTASSLNGMDGKVAQGYMRDYMEHRFPLIPGLDVVGVVDEVGPGVQGLQKGEAVFGVVGKPYQGEGSLAELTTASAATLAHKPDAVEDVVAATLPVAGTTALMAVDEAQLKEGDAVLVVGASGGVGSFATELAARRGARVLAVGRGENTDYLKGLGAAEVIDYSRQDLVQEVRRLAPEGLAAVIDLVNRGEALQQLTGLVRDGGIVISALGAAPQTGAERGIRGLNLGGSVTPDRLSRLAELVAGGELQAPALTRFSLEDSGKALAQVAGGHVRGKLVVALD